jgi:ribose 5-phosphate isomerase A
MTRTLTSIKAIITLSAIEQSKRLAAYTAVDKHILPEHKVSLVFISICLLELIILCRKVIGIGSGMHVLWLR